jgi:hypothetical protein
VFPRTTTCADVSFSVDTQLNASINIRRCLVLLQRLAALY